MSPIDVLVVGESLLDVVRRPDGSEQVLPGGSAANTAVALARVGRPAGLLTCLADDEGGRRLAAHVEGAGAVLVGDPWVLERTSTAVARTGGDGAVSYEFDVEWAPRSVEADTARAVHVGSLAAVMMPGAEVVHDQVRRAGDAVVSFDVNARPSITGSGAELVARVEALVAAADVVKVSDEDIESLWPRVRSHRQVVERLLELGAASVVLTRGARGAQWFDGTHEVSVQSPGTRVVDTIGAGDTLAAVLLDSLLDVPRPWGKESVHVALTRAVMAAAITVSRPGADPPWGEELRRAVASRDADR